MLIGIDLGTTNSLVACFRNGRAELIPNRLGNVLTPSVVSIDEAGKLYIGEAARERALLHPLQSAAVFKRSMGTDRDFRLGDRHFRAEELSSLILKSLKEDAEAHLGELVTDAIISVPAYFNDHQRKATKRAGELAGLNVVRIINEPTAAAIAHGMAEQDDARYLVFDLGGGTFDVSILELYSPIMEVHAIAGDNFLGGEDFTKVLCDLFYAHAGVSPETLDVRVRAEVRKTAERCKCAFSDTPTVIMICNLGEKTHAMPLTLQQYEAACAPLLERLRKPVERSLRDAKVSLQEIDRVVLVGGATRSPVIRRFVERLFGRKPSLRIDPDVAVALGAALARDLRERGITVIHLRIPVSAEDSSAEILSRTEAAIRDYCRLYPRIGAVLDLRRTAELTADGRILATQGYYDGGPCAQVGVSVSGGRDGEAAGLDLMLAQSLRESLWAVEPTLTRPTRVKSGQGLAGDLPDLRVLTLEIGSAGNTYGEACATVEPLGEAIAAVLEKYS